MLFLDLLFPRQCLDCRKNGQYLCHDCIVTIPIVKQKCIVCEKWAIDGFTHPKCASKYNIDRIISFWAYERAIRKAILSLKYKFASEIAKELADHISKIMQQTNLHILPDSLLVPIPLHWHRQNWRGFNQVAEIGKRLSLSINLKYEPNLLIRAKKAGVQAGLKAEERVKNIDGVFQVNKFTRLNQPVILFDDVYTTGSTLKEAGKVLKKAGAKTVWAITIAR